MSDEMGPATPAVTAAPSPRALRWWYAGAALLLLLPVWGVWRVPTIDGGCHLYNAFVMRHLHDPAYPLFGKTFRLSLAPVPNWLMQVLLLPLLDVLSLATAERVLLTLYVALFALAAWTFAGCDEEARAPWAFLALPFAWNLLLHYGFYNFVFSVPLALLDIALWWRWRDRLSAIGSPAHRAAGLRRLLALEALLVVTYFAHLVALAMALGAIGVLWLLDLGRARWQHGTLRRWLLHPLLLAPQLLLPWWYLRTQGGAPLRNEWPWLHRVLYLGELQALFAYRSDTDPVVRGETISLPGIALALTLLGLAIASIVRERPRTARHHAFLVLSLIAAVVYLDSPGGVGTGVVMQPRLSLFPGLLLLAGLSPRLGRRTQTSVAALATLLLAWEMVDLTRWHRATARRIDAYLAGLAPVSRDARVVPIVWNRFGSLQNAMLGHSSGYVLAPRGAIDWDDYEPTMGYFPLHFMPWLREPDHIETDIDDFRLGRYVAVVDYVYVWGMPSQSPLRTRLRYFYRPVADAAGQDGVGQGRLWQRRPGTPVVRP